jgi:hypothetical protein
LLPILKPIVASRVRSDLDDETNLEGGDLSLGSNFANRKLLCVVQEDLSEDLSCAFTRPILTAQNMESIFQAASRSDNCGTPFIGPLVSEVMC